jgi:hypothetical protein
MSDGRRSELYAVLIGVDCYLEGKLPDGTFYRNLGGCVHDILRTERFLRDRLGLADRRILKLTASNAGTGRPTELPEQWPTYENIIRVFKEVARTASPGDQVYIHYSGHGGRARTIFPELKGEGGRDESLVPTNISQPDARYVRDVELAHLLKTMVDKRLVVTVVLDSCHSGSMTRGDGGATVRGGITVDNAERPTESLVATKEELAASWRSLLPDGADLSKPGSGWVPEPQGYVLLAACSASEGANEYAFDGQLKNGALTHWLLESLKQVEPNLTYRMLYNRIVAKVHAQFTQQTPQLQGEGDRIVFGSDSLVPLKSVNVLKVAAEPPRVLLATGDAHRVKPGAAFAVYSSGETNYSKAEARLAVVEVEKPGPTTSWAAVTKRFGDAQIEVGASAVLLDVGAHDLKGAVSFTLRDDLPPDVNQEESLRRVEALMAEGECGWLRRAAPGEASAYQVVVNADGDYEVWDPQGCLVPHLRPALRTDDPLSPARLLKRLTHLTKYRNVRLIDNDEPYASLARALELEVAALSVPSGPGEKPLPRPSNGQPGPPTVGVGEWLFLRVRNISPRPLNVTVLDLRPSWGVKQVFPAYQDYESFEPGQEQLLPLRANLPAGYDQGTDVLKAFATFEATNFRWLELPPLDAPPEPRPSLRSPANALEAMLSMYAAGKVTRDTELDCAFAEWTTAAVEVNIRRT